MRVLVLGGTLFLGRHLVESALDRGDEVTLFNRGRTNPELFPGVELLQGDRKAGDLEALHNRSWDAVVDTSARVPRWVRDSAGLLADRVEHYTFVSSASVYADTSAPGTDESSPCTGSKTRRSRRSRAPRSTAASRCSASRRPSGRCPDGRSRSAPG